MREMMTDGLSCESLTYDSPCFVRELDMRRSSLIVGVGARFLILPRATRTCGAGEMISTRPGLAGTERRGGPGRNSSAWSPDWSVYRPGGGSLRAQTQIETRNVFIERGLG